MDESENISSNPRLRAGARTIGEIAEARLSRRGVLGGLLAAGGLGLAGCASDVGETVARASLPESGAGTGSTRFSFEEITRGIDGTHHVPAGYRADILARWGEPLFADSPAFDPLSQTGAAQRRQVGYNHDFIGFVPLPSGEDGAERALLCVNHEYTSTRLMFPGLDGPDWQARVTREMCAVEIAAHGASIFEIAKRGGRWQTVIGSRFNRRITADGTPIRLTGPAAGHARLKTNADPSGEWVAGTMNNCAGGITPWGTYLMAEENFNGYFRGELPDGHREAAQYERYGVPGGWYQWGRFYERFDLSSEPNEPNRFGWVVEVDPKDPSSLPKKRTALGRFKHEGAESVVAPNGRLVIYMGDDQRFDYLYKFVSARPVDPDNRAANLDLLDEGTLYVARFEEDGWVDWIPLVHGEGPLTAENGFDSQADVLIETRRAADLLGATPMDRPEDVEPDAKTGRVYVMLTNNTRRNEDQVDAANPRANNAFGHIIELIEPEGDFAATRTRWEMLVKCGDPANPDFGAMWNPLTSENGWFGSPDNCAIDPMGRLWIATDGNQRTGANDGLWALETQGTGRGTGRAFFRCPVGAELCGPRFDETGQSLFVAVQHPGDGDDATFLEPSTRWPDFEDNRPPRPAIVAITKPGGGVIGT